MFLGYEGTPWYLWKYTAWLSLFLLVLFIKAIVSGKSRKFNMFFFIQIFVPLMLVIGISFIKPLFVNRYLISVTIAEIILLTLALAAIKNKAIQISMGLILILGTSWFNLWYPDKHAKFPYRQTMAIVNATRQNRDYIYATSSLNYFETLYYAKNRNGVLLHNTSGYRFPWYVGDAIFDQKQMVYKLPTYPYRALLVTPEGKISISYDLHTISKP